jgi:plastocyanin
MLQSFGPSRRILAACAGAALVLAAGAIAHGQAAGPTVKISNFTFAPQTLTVAPGTTVTWVNDDDVPHTVTAVDRSFKSKPLDTGDKFAFTFAKAGEYAYFCSIHPMMTGKVIVKG